MVSFVQDRGTLQANGSSHYAIVSTIRILRSTGSTVARAVPHRYQPSLAGGQEPRSPLGDRPRGHIMTRFHRIRGDLLECDTLVAVASAATAPSTSAQREINPTGRDQCRGFYVTLEVPGSASFEKAAGIIIAH